MIIHKSSHKSLQELVAHPRKFYDKEKIAANGLEVYEVCKKDSMQFSHLQLTS